MLKPLFNKVAGPRTENITKNLRTVFFIEHFKWLFLIHFDRGATFFNMKNEEN